MKQSKDEQIPEIKDEPDYSYEGETGEEVSLQIDEGNEREEDELKIKEEEVDDDDDMPLVSW